MQQINELKNPLEYFSDLIFHKQLTKKVREFEKGNEFDHNFRYDKTTEERIYEELNYETGELYEWKEPLKDYIRKEVIKETKKILKVIDNLLFDSSIERKTEIALSIIEESEFLINRIVNYTLAEKHLVIKESLEYICKYIRVKYPRIALEEKRYSNAEEALIELIRKNCENEEDKERLLNKLKNIQNPKVSIDKKIKSGGALKKFLDSMVSESGKKIVQGITENGADFVKYIFTNQMN